MLIWQRVKNVGVLLKYAASTYLISALYPKFPILIQDIEFTSRQWDILAAFYPLKKPQLIGNLLGIGNKGVEAHIYNIKQKLPFKRKDLSLFLDTCSSSTREALQKHYRYLLVEKVFLEMLKILRSKVGSQGLTYQWIQDKDPPQDFPLSHINNHLAIAGITLSIKDHPQAFILDYQEEFSDPMTYYMSFIKLLESMLPEDKIQDIFQDFFKQQADILSGFSVVSDKQSLSQENFEVPKWNIQKHIKVFLTAPEYNIHRYVGGLILSLLITLLAGFLLPSNASTISPQQKVTGEGNVAVQGEKNTVSTQNQISSVQAHHIQKLEQHFYSHAPPQRFQFVRSDLMIPAKSILLERPDLIHKIHKHLHSEKGISTIVLTGIVGMGGVGKTTLARYYGSFQKDSSVVWELNAESRSSLINSFWNLSYALAQTSEQQQRLDSLRASPDSKLKESLLMQFVRLALKSTNNWILLYDNLENIEILQDCFPQDTNAWGQGKVIITSRNLNLKNSSYINNQDIIYLGQLTPQESQELFVKILYQKSFQELLPSLQEEIQDFLKKIPPFPLDVSTAAYYIKNTGLSCTEYLRQIQACSIDFDKTQQSFLKEWTHYTQTRYGIVTLTLKKLIDKNFNFQAILFFISLLDSQNIPKELFLQSLPLSDVNEFLLAFRKEGLISHEIKTYDLLFSLHRSIQELIGAFFHKTLSAKTKDTLLTCFSQNIKSYFHKNEGSSEEMLLLLQHLEAFEEKNLAMKFLKPQSSNMLFLYFCLGNIHAMQTHHYVKADNYLKKLEQSSGFEKIFSILEKATLFKNLAEIYSSDLCDIKRAIFCAQKSISFAQHIDNSELLLAENYCALGDAYRHINNFQESHKSLMQGLEIASAVKDSTKKQRIQAKIYIVAALLHYVALDQNNAREGLVFVKKAIHCLHADALFYKDLAPNPVKIPREIAFARWVLGFLYLSLQQYDQAIEEGFKEAEYILNKYCPHILADKARMLQGYGGTLLRLGKDLELAEKMLDEAVFIRDSIFGVKNSLGTRNFQAESKIRLKKYDDAYKTCMIVLEYQERERNNVCDLHYIQLIYHAGVAAMALGNVQKSMEHFQHFLKESDIFCKGFLSQESYKQLQQEGALLVDAQKPLSTIIQSYFEKSLKIFTAIYGDEHSFVKDYAKANVDFYKIAA